MKAQLLILLLAVGFLVLASGVVAASARVRILAAHSGTDPGVSVSAISGSPTGRQIYSAFGFRIRAPSGERIDAHWSTSCVQGSRSHQNSGDVKVVGRGATPVTFWRPPSITNANGCQLDLIALRSVSARLTASILGRR
jgi:hypothetical protein